MKKLKFSQLFSISLMLFAIFFGAGNMIFPPAMGQLAGTNYLGALAGFITTDAGIAILGIAAIVLVGTSMSDLGNLVGKRFATFLSISVYLLIGPLFALPRTGSVSFELAGLPYVASDGNTMLYSIAFTAIFFGITYFLSSNPSKVVDIVGKILTPILLLSIVAIFIGSLVAPITTGDFVYGELQAPVGDYQNIAYFKGMIEGYNALDGPAGLAFAIIVINAIKGFGVSNKKDIAKYTIVCGLGAAVLLGVVYFMLTYVGAISGNEYANGGMLLHSVTNHLFGPVGGLLLGIAVLFACLTTSIGLTTSFSDYFVTLFPNLTYKKIAALVCLFSFAISNIGLSQLITVSLPVLIMIYPVTIVLITLSFLKSCIKGRKMVYILGMLFAFVIAFVNGLQSVGVELGFLTSYVSKLPMHSLSLGWVLPAIVGSCLGFLPVLNKKFIQDDDRI